MATKNVKDFLTVNSLSLSTASILTIVGGELKRFTGQTIVIDSSGNVGIGATPSAKLTIGAGNIRLDDNQYILWGGNTCRISGNNTSNILSFFTNSIEGMRVVIPVGNNSRVNIGPGALTSLATISNSSLLELIGTGTGVQRGLRISSSTDGTRFMDLLIQTTTGNTTLNVNGANTLTLQTNSTNALIIGGTQTVTIPNLNAGGTVSAGVGTGLLTAASDARMKIFDGEVKNAIDKIQNLKPKYFYWKDENNNKDESKGRQLGFFAQEVNEQVPEAAPGLNDQWGIYDRSLIAVLVKAVQELKVEIDILKNK